MKDSLEKRITFLQSRQFFWTKQRPIYSRLHFHKKIAAARQKCPLVRSYAQEQAGNFNFVLTDKNSSRAEIRATLKKVVEFQGVLERKNDLRSLLVYNDMLARHFLRSGEYRESLKYYGKLKAIFEANGAQEALLECCLQMARINVDLGQYQESNRL